MSCCLNRRNAVKNHYCSDTVSNTTVVQVINVVIFEGRDYTHVGLVPFGVLDTTMIIVKEKLLDPNQKGILWYFLIY